MTKKTSLRVWLKVAVFAATVVATTDPSLLRYLWSG